ncbi:hypothetical protein [Micromonospora sp. NPDC048843]|uniref:WXG100-like domain-containing protein n=1 Tax=unclassified Micromonospora TaxID=2617518 RepID=UPI0033E059B0
MGLELPGELVTALSWIGYDWPDADETALFEMGQAWLGFADTIEQTVSDSTGAVQPVVAQNSGDAMDAFRAWWEASDSPVPAIASGATAALVLGAGLMVCAAVVLFLKVQMIVQLIILAVQVAQAIATAVATFGASLLEIPVFQAIARAVVGMLIDQAMGMLLGG